MVDLERRLARSVEVTVTSKCVVLAHNDLLVISFELHRPSCDMPYRLTASGQLNSRILLLVVLPECRLKGLQQAGIAAGQSFDICVTVSTSYILRGSHGGNAPATTFESCIRQSKSGFIREAVPTNLSRRGRFNE